MKKVAVVTDALSAAFFFPAWCRYYGANFGNANLFVVTFVGLKHLFAGEQLGAVLEMPTGYNDTLRAKFISQLVATLLTVYDVVLRVDVDEFLVPLDSGKSTLQQYVNDNSKPYVTAYGIDIIEEFSEDDLDPSRPMLVHQRKVAVNTTALNKTCLTSVALTWANGFHAANHYPVFDHLALFHCKFADIKRRVLWFEQMTTRVDRASREYAYFSDGADKLIKHQKRCMSLPLRPANAGIIDPVAHDKFLNSVAFNPHNGIYQGHFQISSDRFTIPEQYTGIF